MSKQEQQTKPDGGASVSTAMLGAGATTKWRICDWKDAIEPVVAVGETACFITVREKSWNGKEYDRREKKDGKIFDTFEAAKEAFVEDARQRVKGAEAEWQRCKDRLKKRNDIKAPNANVTGLAPEKGNEE